MAIETLRPTVQSVSGTEFATNSNPEYAYDGDTESYNNLVTVMTGADSDAIYREWGTKTGVYSRLELKVRTVGIAGGDTHYIVSYSVNNGSTWTTIQSGAFWGAKITIRSLPIGTDLNQLQVKANLVANNEYTGNVEVYEIWTEGTLAPTTGASFLLNFC